MGAGVSNSRLSVAALDPELAFAGGETQVLGLALALRDMGHDVTLLCDPRGALWQRARTARLFCLPLSIRNSIDLSAGLKLRTYVKERRWQVVHFHTARAHSLAPFVRDLGCASIVTRRTDKVPNRLFAPWLFNRCVDRVVAISEAVAQALVNAGVDRARIQVIHSGVDCTRFSPPSEDQRQRARQSFALEESELAVGAVGALEARKGHSFLLQALAELKQNGLTPKCFIAGAGSLRNGLAAMTADMGLTSQVQLLDRLDDVRPLLQALDIFVMPSLREGLGVSLLEAMACGLAVVGSDVGGISEVIENEQNGLLVPAANAKALAQAIDRLAAAPELRKTLGDAARRRVVERFSLDATVARTLGVYRSCLENR